jgi:mannosyltransferase OCH1-like enzyme
MILHKYGGVWADMDIVFLRDFKPILDQEYMYQWGGDTDFAYHGACATVLAMKKESEFSHRMLDVVKTMPALGDTTIWGKDTFAKLWREWPNFTIFPSTFFNTQWLISKTDPEFRSLLGHGFSKIQTDKDFLFLDAFAWHWHNTSNKDREIEEGSKFDWLRKRTDSLLKEKGVL